MIVAATIADVDAKKGNNGQCRQVQKTTPARTSRLSRLP